MLFFLKEAKPKKATYHHLVDVFVIRVDELKRLECFPADAPSNIKNL